VAGAVDGAANMRRAAYSFARWRVPVRPAGQVYDTPADMSFTFAEAGLDASGASVDTSDAALDAMLARLSGDTGAPSPTASTLTPDHTVWYIAGGAVVLLAAIGATVYVVTRKKKRK